MSALTLRQVVKRYGAQTIVHGIDLDVAAGEFVVIVGPSGCGKSTLLRMVAGLEEISGGTIEIGGRTVNDLEPKDRDIAMVFQNYALYPHMRVYDNLAYGLRNRGTPKAEIDERVREAARILELEPLLDRKPKQLSGGQRQRVAMGRAIVRRPVVFLFDEPLSNLDAKLRVQMRLELNRLHRRLGVTSLYVTHDQVEAMTLGQRIVVMNAGRIEQVGPPDTVYREPATTFVAGFIGAPPMNLLTGRIADDGRDFIGDDMVLPLPDGPRPAGGRPVVLGIRPEHLHVRPEGIEAQVEMVESLGAEQLVHLRIGRHALVMRHDTDTMPAGTSETRLAFTAADLRWFDPQTGQRVAV